MKRWLPLGLTLVLLSGIGGCKSTRESIAAEAEALMEQMMVVLESVNDDASAQAAVTKLEALGVRMKELQARAAALGTPSKEEIDRAIEKAKANEKEKMEEFKKKQQRYEAAFAKASKYPAVMQAFAKAMMGDQAPNFGGPAGSPFNMPPGGPRAPRR